MRRRHWDARMGALLLVGVALVAGWPWYAPKIGVPPPFAYHAQPFSVRADIGPSGYPVVHAGDVLPLDLAVCVRQYPWDNPTPRVFLEAGQVPDDGRRMGYIVRRSLVDQRSGRREAISNLQPLARVACYAASSSAHVIPAGIRPSVYVLEVEAVIDGYYRHTAFGVTQPFEVLP